MKKFLFINFKTTCAIEFENGVHHYVNHPTFEVLLCTYAIDPEDIKYADIISEPNLDNISLEDDYVIAAYGLSFTKLVIEKIYPSLFSKATAWIDIKDINAKCFGHVALGIAASKLNIKTSTEKSVFFCFNGSNREDFKNISLKNKQNLIHNAKMDLYTAIQIYRKTIPFIKSFDAFIMKSTRSSNERGIDIDIELLNKALILTDMYKNKGFTTTKTSWLKYGAISKNIYEGKIYNFLNYHGCVSGRFTSSNKIALQNFQRSESAFFKEDIQRIKELNINFEEIPTVLGRAVRGLIIPPPSHMLYIGDFKQIEPRIIAWLTDDPMLPKLAGGYPLYENMASKIFGKNIQELSTTEIKIGKITVLSATYGIGVSELAKNYHLSHDLAEKCINTFRAAHPKVFEMAWDAEKFMKYAIQHNKDQEKMIGKILIRKQGDDFLIYSPCGEFFVYKNCALIKRGGETLMFHGGQLYYMKIFSHICQFICRNILCQAVLDLQKNGINTLFTVHDEVIASHYLDRASDFELILKSANKETAYKEIPLDVKIKITDRYC